VLIDIEQILSNGLKRVLDACTPLVPYSDLA
jgi:hypothetical protein